MTTSIYLWLSIYLCARPLAKYLWTFLRLPASLASHKNAVSSRRAAAICFPILNTGCRFSTCTYSYPEEVAASTKTTTTTTLVEPEATTSAQATSVAVATATSSTSPYGA